MHLKLASIKPLIELDYDYLVFTTGELVLALPRSTSSSCFLTAGQVLTKFGLGLLTRCFVDSQEQLLPIEPSFAVLLLQLNMLGFSI